MYVLKYSFWACVLSVLLFCCTGKEHEAPVTFTHKADSLLRDSTPVNPQVDSLKKLVLKNGATPQGMRSLNQLSQHWNGLPGLWTAEAASVTSARIHDSYGETEALCSKAAYYYEIDNKDLMGAMADSAYLMAGRFKYKPLLAEALLWKGRFYMAQNHGSMAEGFYNEALTMARETGDKGLEASILRNIGSMYNFTDRYKEAGDYYRQALQAAEVAKDEYQVGDLLNKVGDSYRMISDYPQAISCLNKAIALATRLGDKALLATSLCNLGNTYYLQDENDKALEYYKQSYKLAKEVNDLDQIAYSLSGIGEVYRMQNDYAAALHCFSEAMAIAKKTHNDYRMSDCLSSMGEIYRMQDDYSKALDYYTQSMEIGKKSNDKERIAYCYSSIGEVYTDRKEYDKAMDCFRRALVIAREIDDKIREADCLSCIGKALLAQNVSAIESGQPAVPGRYEEAMDYLEEARGIAEDISDKNEVADCLNNMGEIQLRLKHTGPAEAYAEQAMAASRASDMPENIKTAAELLYKVYDQKNNYKGAFQMLQLYLQMKDSINNEGHVKNFVSQEFNAKNEEMKLEQSKKDILYKAEQIKREAEIRRQKTIRYALTTGFVLLLALAGVVFRSLQQNKRKNKIITGQKQEVEYKSQLLEQRNKEMMDSIHYAQRIQKALLASDSLLNNNLSGIGAGYFIYFNPKDVVSGDFYWATKSHGKFYLVVADSTGHGVPGAFMSLLNISFLNEAINEKGLQKPNDILAHVRSKLVQVFNEDEGNQGNKDGMDCSLLCFDLNSLLLEFSCANNPLVLIRNNQVIEQPSDRMPVGKSPKEHEPYTLHRLQLQKGDAIYAFTDGYIDQFGGPKGKKFMYRRLNELLLSCHGMDMQEQQALLQKVFTEWKGGLEQVDDVLVAGIRV